MVVIRSEIYTLEGIGLFPFLEKFGKMIFLNHFEYL